MMPKPKNIIIFVAILAIFVFIYFFFLRKPAEEPLVSSSDLPVTSPTGTNTEVQNSAIAQDFLSLLLNVRNIKINDALFADVAFTSLHDSSITLVPEGNEGRPNPFAPLGVDATLPPANTLNPNTPTAGTP
jgi:hypothetical protein